MNFQEILDKIKTKNEVIESKEDLGVLNAWVAGKNIKAVIAFMKDELKFTQLSFVTAVDLMASNQLDVVYQLYSYETNDNAVIRVKLDRLNPGIDSVSAIFAAANWHERETAEMFGIKFTGHPDPNRLLLPDGIEAPLRKDFKDTDMIPMPKA